MLKKEGSKGFFEGEVLLIFFLKLCVCRGMKIEPWHNFASSLAENQYAAAKNVCRGMIFFCQFSWLNDANSAAAQTTYVAA